MKKRLKVDFRLVIALAVMLSFTVLVCVIWKDADLAQEEKIYSSYQENKEDLTLKSNVIVINTPLLSDDELTNSERMEREEQYMRQLQYMMEKGFKRAKGVFFLGTDMLSQSVIERQFMRTFRDAGNVFWHYNVKNIGYYHEEDKCGQIKYIDKSYGGKKRFEVMGVRKYDKNFLPYFLMTMDGSSVRYDKKEQVYYLKDKTGRTGKIHSMGDGTVCVRRTSKYEVKYYELKTVYQMIRNSDEAEEKFRDAVIFIQDDKTTYSYNNELGDASQSLADYYIDVLGTIENRATVPYFTIGEKVVFCCIGVLIIGLAVMFLPTWFAILVYILEIGCACLANIFLYQYNVRYIPVVIFLLQVTLAFLMMFILKNVLQKISVKNLPIDAVIRFTNTIVNIEHSVSYSEYLMKNREEIEEDISASLLLPVMDRNSFLLEQLAEENHRNRRFVETEFWNTGLTSTSVIQVRSNIFQGVKYIAFVPLPVFDSESEIVTYTVIGLKKKLKPQNASYVSMMLFSMYIYFKAQHERGEHQRMYFAMLSLMISVIDAKDPITAGHSQRVANISKDIGIWMHLSKSEQFDLEFTALLHDIGKIGVSDYVLNKQSVYTQEDFEQMKYHTIRGAEMLAEVGISEEIIDGVRHHHERMDGKGYPDGLRGNELSLFAKIIKIADVYDALTSKRQYKDAWGVEKALNIIYRGRGTEFDEKIADVFIEHMSPPGWIPPADDGRASERRDPFAEKAARIARDFFWKYSQYISVEYPIPSKKASRVDVCCQAGFMGFDWGETFNNAEFLEVKPMILAYENESKSLLFGQSSKCPGIHSIYYYFFKGFVNMGVYLLEPVHTREILAELEAFCGEPQVMDDQMMIYTAQKMRVVFYHTGDDRCLLLYISDYMCSNYIFQEEDQR